MDIVYEYGQGIDPKNDSLRLYADERTEDAKAVITALERAGLSYSFIPTSGSLPILRGPRAFKWSLRAPGTELEHLDDYLKEIAVHLKK